MTMMRRLVVRACLRPVGVVIRSERGSVLGNILWIAFFVLALLGSIDMLTGSITDLFNRLIDKVNTITF